MCKKEAPQSLIVLNVETRTVLFFTHQSPILYTQIQPIHRYKEQKTIRQDGIFLCMYTKTLHPNRSEEVVSVH